MIPIKKRSKEDYNVDIYMEKLIEENEEGGNKCKCEKCYQCINGRMYNRIVLKKIKKALTNLGEENIRLNLLVDMLTK